VAAKDTQIDVEIGRAVEAEGRRMAGRWSDNLS